jgi:tRNA(Ile2) C34 agmatinyltransferase TiaS
MSDYVYAKKMSRNGCPDCGGDNSSKSDYKFRCEDCGFAFP